MPLTHFQCKNAKPKHKKFKLFDGNGLFLEVRPNGSKKWRQKYRFGGKEKLLTHGDFTDTDLATARQRRDSALKLLKADTDPAQIKQKIKLERLSVLGNDFKSLAEEWHKSKESRWNDRYAEKIKSRLSCHVHPLIGSLPISEITAPEILVVVRKLEEMGMTDLHSRVLQYINQVFIYSIALGHCKLNPAAGLGSIIKPVRTQHYKYLKADELKGFFEDLEVHSCNEQTKIALKLVILTGVRSGELRFATWSEIDLRKSLWSIPAERMKMKRPHVSPLSKQAKKLFERLFELNSYSKYVLPSRSNSSKPICENTLIYTIHRMGYKNRATVHGFRATMSTILNEQGFNSDAIERQLAHIEKNKVRAAYNHAEYLPEREKMMQKWADYLDELRSRN